MSVFERVKKFILEQVGEEWLGQKAVRQWLLAAFFFVVLAGLLLANLGPNRLDLEVGQVAKRDVEAPRRVINRFRTEQLKEDAARRAVKDATEQETSYEINQAVAVTAEDEVEGIFAQVRQARPDPAVKNTNAAPPSVRQLHSTLRDTHRVQISEVALQELVAAPKDQLDSVEKDTRALVSGILQKERLSRDDVESVRDEMATRVRDAGISEKWQPVVAEIARQMVRPNLILDPRKVEREREQAVRSVKPVYVEQGQIIMRKGDLVEQEHIQILQDLGMLQAHPNYGAMAGLVLLVLILVVLVGYYIRQYNPEILDNESHLALVGLLLVVGTGLAKVAAFIPFEGTGYLVPVALSSMLVTILLDSRLAVVVSVFLAVVVGIVMGQDMKFAMVALVSGIVAVFSVSKVSQRSALTRAGLVVGAGTFVAMVSLGLLRAESFLVKYSFLGFVNGVVSAIGAIGVLPYLETVFSITSSVRLLELSNPNHPLLRKLLMEAPGSYHHSMMVGNLAEAAAEVIGGDALMTRVGAQYHDIGKVKRPYFFVENQFGGENPHDKIAPTLSTLIITSHVKDGAELAKQHRLPDVIIGFIRSHHGTDLVKYFYHKALEQSKGEGIAENDFRYSGPKPRTKEEAVVMLADSVEAAVRSLSKPTPGRIEGQVRKIIKDRLNDGQLDESDVTLGDLDSIAEAFVKVLTGIFHSRIEYPEVIKEIQAERGN